MAEMGNGRLRILKMRVQFYKEYGKLKEYDL
jgi:hypothetical protein